MNMSLTNLDDLTTKFPQDCDTIQRLANFIGENSDKSARKFFTLQRLYDLASPSTTFVFAQLLNHLVENGVLRKIVRIESPSLGGIEDFPSIMDVPETIFDWHQGVTINVTPENIRVFYQVVSIQND